jgi:uncharacterized DUF497 family protein
MEFEWDERKRCENIRKHGFDFAECAPLFRRRTVIVPDLRFDYVEQRYRAMGLVRERVVVVVFVERGDVLRIISMRKANRNEQTFYFESFED